ncbi:hypothetical protein BWR59_02130 [Pseudomonas sp. Bc-h]|nr:hypothetical protein BWR59_02130 [Pseudomonas sp. Bc-h]
MNGLARVERFQDGSGKSTFYTYDDRAHLIAVTDALNHTTKLERKPDGEVLRIDHPDGTAESFTCNALGQVLTLTRIGPQGPSPEKHLKARFNPAPESHPGCCHPEASGRRTPCRRG